MAFAPLVSLFGELLDDAAAEGAIRPDLRRSPIAGMVLEAIMFNAFSTTIGGLSAQDGSGDPAEQLWSLLFRGMATPG